MTRQQRYMSRAMDDVQTVAGHPSFAKQYGGLCHTVPVYVRTNGLCQALAFVEDKASGMGERAQAYQALRRHLAGLLGLDSPERLLDAVRRADATTYVRYTRTVLETGGYYKRFAVSILKVEAGEDGGERV